MYLVWLTEQRVYLSVTQQRWVGRDEASESCCAAKLHLGVSLCPHVLVVKLALLLRLQFWSPGWTTPASSSLLTLCPASRSSNSESNGCCVTCASWGACRSAADRPPSELWWDKEPETLSWLWFVPLQLQDSAPLWWRKGALQHDEMLFFCLGFFFLIQRVPETPPAGLQSACERQVRTSEVIAQSHWDGMMFVSLEDASSAISSLFFCQPASKCNNAHKGFGYRKFLIALILPVLIIVCFKDSWRVLQSGETRRFLRLGDR